MWDSIGNLSEYVGERDLSTRFDLADDMTCNKPFVNLSIRHHWAMNSKVGQRNSGADVRKFG